MDDEGRRLANLSDAEWQAHVAGLARDHRWGAAPKRASAGWRWVLMLVSLGTAGVTIALLLSILSSARHSDRAESAIRTDGPPFSHTEADDWDDAPTGLQMPDPQTNGRYSAADVRSAQDLVKNYLLTVATSTAVLKQHELTAALNLIEPDQKQDIEYARQTISVLADGNDVRAPVRALSSISVTAVAAHGQEAQHLHFDVNAIWAYALHANYAVASSPNGVVTVHEHTQIDVHFRPGTTPAGIWLTSADRQFGNSDCGFADENQFGLERAADPRQLPDEAVSSTSVSDRFALDSPLDEVVGCQTSSSAPAK